jgi:hypothetical protein
MSGGVDKFWEVIKEMDAGRYGNASSYGRSCKRWTLAGTVHIRRTWQGSEGHELEGKNLSIC